MRLNIKFLLVLLVAMFIGCGTSSKSIPSVAKIKQLDSLVSSKSFQIISDWAMPRMTSGMNSIASSGLLPPGSSASQINLIGNSNFLKVEGDTISAFLPYYGERQMGGGYSSSDNAIEFKGIPENYKVVNDEKKQNKEISFNINNSTESFRVFITLTPDLSSYMTVNSSQRFSIEYRGVAESISTQ